MYTLAYINVINPGQEVEPDLKSFAQNPKKILKFAEQYPWSTHQEYLDKRSSIIIDKGIAGNLFLTPQAYEQFVSDIIKGKQKIHNSFKKNLLE